MSRFRMLSDAQWSLIESMLPRPTGRPGRKFSDARLMVEAINYRYLSVRDPRRNLQRRHRLIGA